MKKLCVGLIYNIKKFRDTVNAIYYQTRLWLYRRSKKIDTSDLFYGTELNEIDKLLTMNDRMNKIYYDPVEGDDENIIRYKRKMKRTRTLMIYVVIMLVILMVFVILLDIFYFP